MSIFALLAVIWAVGIVATFGYLFYTDKTDHTLSEDERVDTLAMVWYAVIWPILAVLWIVAKVIDALRNVHDWFTSH